MRKDLCLYLLAEPFIHLLDLGVLQKDTGLSQEMLKTVCLVHGFPLSERKFDERKQDW